jgi:hypothetical protein
VPDHERIGEFPIASAMRSPEIRARRKEWLESCRESAQPFRLKDSEGDLRRTQMNRPRASEPEVRRLPESALRYEYRAAVMYVRSVGPDCRAWVRRTLGPAASGDGNVLSHPVHRYS